MAQLSPFQALQRALLMHMSEPLWARLSASSRAALQAAAIAGCASITPADVRAQWVASQHPVNPNSCAQVGGTLSGALAMGSGAPYDPRRNYALDAAKRQIAELGGRALGYAACPPRALPAPVADHGHGNQPLAAPAAAAVTSAAPRYPAVSATPRQPDPNPTVAEVELLRTRQLAMAQTMVEWEETLRAADRTAPGTESHRAARGAELIARQRFAEARALFVRDLDQVGNVAGKNVDRFYRAALAALEYPTDGSVVRYAELNTLRERAAVRAQEPRAPRSGVTAAPRP